MKVNYDTHNNTHQFLRNSLKLKKIKPKGVQDPKGLLKQKSVVKN